MSEREEHLLDFVQIKTVGFVPTGANPGAEILLFKAREDPPMDDNTGNVAKRLVAALAKRLGLTAESQAELLKEVEMADPTVEGLQKQLADLQEEADAQATKLADTEAALAKATAEPESDPEPTEKEKDLEKSLEAADPVLKAHLESLQLLAEKNRTDAAESRAEVEKLKTTNEMARFEGIAKDLPDIADVTDKVEFVRDLYKGLGDDKAKLYVEHLRKSQALVEQAGLFKEWGTDAQPAEAGQALATLEKMAATLAKADKITVPQAFAKVLDDPNNKDLYAQYVREQRAN
jgi:hypothetical protein